MKKLLLLSTLLLSMFLVGCGETPEKKECKENGIPLIKCDKYHQDIEDVQKTIKEVLKAPSTAVFYDMDWADSLPDDYVRGKVENIYGDKQEEITAMQTEVEANAKTYIKGDVDSQNGFGAMGRTKFVCAIGGDINCFYDGDDAESKLAYDGMISLFNIMKKRH